MIALAQSSLHSVTVAGANPAAFASTTAGNLMVVALSYFGGGSDYFSSIAGTNNTYTLIGTVQHANSASDYIRLYYAKNITGGAETVTASFSGSPGSGDTNIAIFEYSGADTTAPLDVSNTAKTGTGTLTPTSNSITTSNNGSLIFVLGVDDNGDSAAPTAGSGYTLRLHQDDSSSHERFYTEDQIQTTAGAITGSFTIANTGSNYAISIAAFKPAASGGVALQPPQMSMMGVGA